MHPSRPSGGEITTHQVRVDLDRSRSQPAVLQHPPDAADGDSFPKAANHSPGDHDILHWLEVTFSVRGGGRGWRRRRGPVAMRVGHGG